MCVGIVFSLLCELKLELVREGDSAGFGCDIESGGRTVSFPLSVSRRGRIQKCHRIESATRRKKSGATNAHNAISGTKLEKEEAIPDFLPNHSSGICCIPYQLPNLFQDYDDFDLANEDDELEEFLGIPRKTPKSTPAFSSKPPTDANNADQAPVENGVGAEERYV